MHTPSQIRIEIPNNTGSFEYGLPERYRALGLLGESELSLTILARDAYLAKRVVIKIARTAKGFPATSLNQEADFLANINHPRIASVFHVGVLADGRPYLVMEWVNGPNLSNLIAQGPFSLRHALEVLYAVAEGVSVTHFTLYTTKQNKPLKRRV